MSKAIAQQLRALADQLDSGGGGQIEPGPYPRIVVRDGASLMAEAPIALDWIPSMTDRELTRFGSFGSDPSNGMRFGQPLRSAAGYPLVYTPDGMGSYRGIQVVYDGVAFPDDNAVAAFKVAVAAQHRDNSPFSPGGPR